MSCGPIRQFGELDALLWMCSGQQSASITHPKLSSELPEPSAAERLDRGALLALERTCGGEDARGNRRVPFDLMTYLGQTANTSGPDAALR